MNTVAIRSHGNNEVQQIVFVDCMRMNSEIGWSSQSCEEYYDPFLYVFT